MLIATSEWRSASAAVETTIVLGAGVRAHLVRRWGLRFDTRFMAGAGAPRDVATVYLVLQGTLERRGHRAACGPIAFVLAEDEYERARPGCTTFRLDGDPAVALDICVPRAHLRMQPGIADGPRPLGARTWDLASALAASRDSQIIGAHFGALLAALRDDGVLAAASVAEHSAAVPQLAPLWSALARLYAHQDTAAYVAALADLAGISLRQTERGLRELGLRFILHGGFRGTLKVLRLRRAVLLLSARDASVSEVARVVGYGSAAAMGRAFRDAGLPPPLHVRQAVGLTTAP